MFICIEVEETYIITLKIVTTHGEMTYDYSQ